MRAIAIDANSMSRGRLSITVIEEIVETIRGYELEAELWIAEPVIWEWAEHAHADLKAAIEKLSSVEESLSDAGLDHRIPVLDNDALDIDSMVGDIEAALTSFREVRLLRLLENPASAYGGIRDQVLQVGAGSSKGAGPRGSSSIRSGILRPRSRSNR